MEAEVEKESVFTRKPNGSPSADPAQDKDPECSTESLARSSIAEFNEAFEEFSRTKSENSIDRLNRCLALLASSARPADVNPESPETATLFINLHELMSTMESRSALLWSALALLEQVIQSAHTRAILVQRFKFMQVLAKLLESVSNPARVLHVLGLLEGISYGICISWQEPYLPALVKLLVKFVNSEKDTLRSSALSVLINLCHKNLPAKYVLLRTVPIEQFLSNIQSQGILAGKMNFLLENNTEHMSKADVHNFIEFTFSEVLRSLKNFNSGLLRHSADFFLEMKSKAATQESFQDYPNYCEDIGKLMKVVNHINREDSSDMARDFRFDWASCLGILLDLLDDLIKSNGEHVTALLPTIVSSAIQWINSDKVGTNALQVLTTIVEMNDDLTYLSAVHDEIIEHISSALVILPQIKVSPAQKTALLKLVGVLIKQSPLKGDYNESMKGFIFDTIFPDFIHTNPQEKPIHVMDTQVPMYVRALAITMRLAELHPEDIWGRNLECLLNMPLVHFIIAKGMLCEDAEICALVFLLSKANKFPVLEVSEKISSQSPLLLADDTKLSLNSQNCFAGNFPGNFVSQHSEQRLDELITKMLEAHRNKEIGNVLMSDVMELFELKVTMCSNAEKDLLARLDECNAEVTTLSHKVAILTAEVSRYQTQTFFLQMTINRLRAEKASLERENSRLKEVVGGHKKAVEEENICRAKLSKIIDQKDAEIKVLTEELQAAAVKVSEQEDDLKYLKNLISTEQAGSRLLEQRIVDLEELTNQLKRQILEKQHCIISRNKEIEDLAKEHSMLEEKLTRTEVLLAEKENLLENYAKDLRDVEEMRTQVVSIIQRKGHPAEHLSSS